MPRRSDCPISNVLDFVGDKWSLLVVRDLMFTSKRSFSELQSSDEHIATNILSARLVQLERDGLINKQVDPVDKRRKIYTLTPKGVDLMPVILEMIRWSGMHDPATNAPQGLLDRIAKERDELIEELRRSVE